MQPFAMVLAVVLAGTPALSRGPAVAARSSVTLPGCLVSLIEEAEVPAQEAGKLESINVRRGTAGGGRRVAGPDRRRRGEDRVGGGELAVGGGRREGRQRHQPSLLGAAAKVAEAEYESALAVNERRPGTVPQMELNRLKLVWDKSVLQIEQAQEDQKVLGLEARVREAELDAAKAEVARRQICSPLSGVVEKLHLHAGEWVKPGDPTFHVVGMDRLRIECFLNACAVCPLAGRWPTGHRRGSAGRRTPRAVCRQDCLRQRLGPGERAISRLGRGAEPPAGSTLGAAAGPVGRDDDSVGHPIAGRGRGRVAGPGCQCGPVQRCYCVSVAGRLGAMPAASVAPAPRTFRNRDHFGSQPADGCNESDQAARGGECPIRGDVVGRCPAAERGRPSVRRPTTSWSGRMSSTRTDRPIRPIGPTSGASSATRSCSGIGRRTPGARAGCW